MVQPTCPPVNENLMELLIILDAFKRASPARITAVLPYYGYARQDRKDMGRVPICAKLVADLLTAAGANRVLCLDLHAAQIQGFFNIPVDHLYAAQGDHRPRPQAWASRPSELVVLSTDEGNVKKALHYQQRLGGQIAVVDKRRVSADRDEGRPPDRGQPVDGKTVVMFDDMISTAGSMAGAVKVAKQARGEEIYVCATHGVLCGDAIRRLADSPISKVVITDTIPLPPAKRLAKIEVLSVASLLATAIQHIHEGKSVSQLFEWSSRPREA